MRQEDQELERINQMITEVRNLFGTDRAPSGAGKESVRYYYEIHSFAHEQHHAMHVLSFFYFLARKTLRGERVNRRMLGRIIHHLMDLREFLEDADLSETVNVLWRGVQAEYDDSLNPLARGFSWGVRALVSQAQGKGEESTAYARINALLIACTEEDGEGRICMYPWLVLNQDKILKFAGHYGKTRTFEGLLPCRTLSFRKDA